MLLVCRFEVPEAEAAEFGTAALDGSGSSPALPVSHSRIGPYTLVRLLGSGGIGSVYLAQRLIGGVPQQLALKILLKQLRNCLKDNKSP